MQESTRHARGARRCAPISKSSLQTLWQFLACSADASTKSVARSASTEVLGSSSLTGAAGAAACSSLAAAACSVLAAGSFASADSNRATSSSFLPVVSRPRSFRCSLSSATLSFLSSAGVIRSRLDGPTFGRHPANEVGRPKSSPFTVAAWDITGGASYCLFLLGKHA